MSQKTWGGRFEGGTDARVEAFTESISYDRRLYRHDVRASQAHARMLAHVGLLTADEAERIAAALEGIAGRIERGDFKFDVELEDIHTHVEKFQRDRDRLADCRRRVNVLPLGAAALAGTSLPIDREFVAKELGFESVARNSLDVSSDRDFVLEFVFCLSTIALHLSGWAEEWVIWSTTEFGFLDLPDAFCTGSSIMPHKKNPDALELIRGKTARVVGALNQLMTLVKGLPLAYNRDLQEDKPNLFDAYDVI